MDDQRERRGVRVSFIQVSGVEMLWVVGTPLPCVTASILMEMESGEDGAGIFVGPFGCRVFPMHLIMESVRMWSRKREMRRRQRWHGDDQWQPSATFSGNRLEKLRQAAGVVEG